MTVNSITLQAEATKEEIVTILKNALLNYEADMLNRKIEFDPLDFDTTFRIIDELTTSFGLEAANDNDL